MGLVSMQNKADPVLDAVIQRLAAADISLQVTQKRVKNVNFRLKPYCLMVSVPKAMRTRAIAQVIERRVPWALDHHPKVLARHQQQQKLRQASNDSDIAPASPLVLWGKPQTLTLQADEKIAHYRQALSAKIPELFDKWQPIVGVSASEVRIKKMHTRWGSCNTHACRIWLSVYLPAYPIACCEYVIVHELCHLHHPNHSRAFWQAVATAMPDYRQWHDKLAGRSGILD